MSARFAVYQAYQDPSKHLPLHYIKKPFGVFLVATGKAIRIGRKAIQLVSQPTAYRGLKCGQADAYEVIAIEKYSRQCVGGLVRNEHSPKILKPFHGARVAH